MFPHESIPVCSCVKYLHLFRVCSFMPTLINFNYWLYVSICILYFSTLVHVPVYIIGHFISVDSHTVLYFSIFFIILIYIVNTVLLFNSVNKSFILIHGLRLIDLHTCSLIPIYVLEKFPVKDICR